jgi:O-acetyl-ADP-ribose deacetylase
MEHAFSVATATLVLLRGNIVHERTEAIANAANGGLLGGGGVDGAIHRAAGPQLLQACKQVRSSLPGGLLATGGAVITPGFGLHAKYVIHCVGPIYDRDGWSAPQLLASCYANALHLCCENRIASIAFPSISTGVYGYPIGEAAPIALAAVQSALQHADAPQLVRFCLFDEPTLEKYVNAARQRFG